MVIITGGTRGVGAQIVADVLAQGGSVVATGTSPATIARLQESATDKVRYFAVDFTVPEQLAHFTEFLKHLDRIDACINNAGVTKPASLDMISGDEWQQVMAINLDAPMKIIQAVSGVMKRQGFGRIVNVASIWAHCTMPSRATYTAAKHGLVGLTKSAAIDLATSNVLVNSVSPGFTETDLLRANLSAERIAELETKIPLGRLAKPSEVSQAVLFPAGPGNTYITGQTLIIDGGYTIV